MDRPPEPARRGVTPNNSDSDAAIARAAAALICRCERSWTYGLGIRPGQGGGVPSPVAGDVRASQTTKVRERPVASAAPTHPECAGARHVLVYDGDSEAEAVAARQRETNVL